MLSSIPGKDGGHRKVKDGADNCSRHPGEPPDIIRREDIGRYSDVGDDTEAADQIENAKAPHEAEAAQSPVPISELIVQEEIRSHCHQRGNYLRGAKTEPHQIKAGP